MPVKINGTTSGSVTLAAPASGSDVTLTLPGSTGTLALATSTGKLLQVIYASTTTETSSSSSTFADTTLTGTITPSATSSKILILVNHTSNTKQTNNAAAEFRLLRGASTLTDFGSEAGSTQTSTDNGYGAMSIAYLDSPSTTSATTYKTQIRSKGNNAVVKTQFYASISTIILMEIAA